MLVVLFIGSALFVERYPALTPWATCTRDCPPNAFLAAVLASRPSCTDVVQPVRELLAALLFAGVAVSLAARWRAAPPLRRQLIGAGGLRSAAGSVVLLVAFFVGPPDRRRTSDVGASDARRAVEPVHPGARGGVLRRPAPAPPAWWAACSRGWARCCSDAGRRAAACATSLAAALRDPSLELLVPDGPARWRDSRGRPAGDLPSAAAGRHVTLIRDDGDAEAGARPRRRGCWPTTELRRAPSAGSCSPACASERLQSRLAASLAQLETSRRRIARAADQERARIERDLHDGAQQRLIALRLRLTLVEELLHTDPEAGAAAVVALGDEVDRTLDELRSLAHGVYPSMLRDRGVAQALRGVAAQSPLPVHVQRVRAHPPLHRARHRGLLHLPRGRPERGQARGHGDAACGSCCARPTR